MLDSIKKTKLVTAAYLLSSNIPKIIDKCIQAWDWRDALAWSLGNNIYLDGAQGIKQLKQVLKDC